MNFFEAYLFTRLDALSALFVSSYVILGLSCFLHITYYAIEDEELKMPDKRLLVPFIFSCIMATLTPSTKDAAIMYGLHYITNNEEAKELPDNVLRLVNDKIEDWTNDESE